jgi:hypothetical protein
VKVLKKFAQTFKLVIAHSKLDDGAKGQAGKMVIVSGQLIAQFDSQVYKD